MPTCGHCGSIIGYNQLHTNYLLVIVPKFETATTLFISFCTATITHWVNAVGPDAGSELRKTIDSGRLGRVKGSDVDQQVAQLTQLLLYNTLDTAARYTRYISQNLNSCQQKYEISILLK